MGKEDVALSQRNCNRSLSQNGDRIAGQAGWGSDPEGAKKMWPLSQRRALEPVLWPAEGATWGAFANTSPNNGACLNITSFFSPCTSQKREEAGGEEHLMGNMCAKYSSCSFLPAYSLTLPLLAHQLVSMYSLVLGAATSGLPTPPILPPGHDGQSFCIIDHFYLFTLCPLLSLAFWSPQPDRQKAEEEPCTSTRIHGSQTAVTGHLKIPISLMERSRTESSSGLGVEPCRETGG